MSTSISTDSAIPAQVIVMQPQAWCEKHPDESFWLRLAENHGIRSQPLSGQQTLAGARTMAISLGYTPTHWVDGAGTLVAA